MRGFVQLGMVFGALVVALNGCGSEGTPTAPGGRAGSGGSGGTGAQSGSGGTAGLGGASGQGGSGGMSAGGTGGSGGSGGVGNSIGAGGTGGFAGTGASCNTNALCHTCPADVLLPSLLCASDDDCTFPGYVCVPSGCTSDGGGALGQCQEPLTSSCNDLSDCRNANPNDHACGPVGAGGDQCLRVTPGCSPETENIDCAPGFACEGGTCVDRRVPCESSFDCPKSYTCEQTPTASYCVRIYRDCNEDTDCGLLAPRCADIDGDGRKECSGELPDGNACVNQSAPLVTGTTRCESDSARVCENGNFGSGDDAECGDYGLCRNDADCPNTFECVALGSDGRKECVPRGTRTCDSSSECSLNQVCASPKGGGTPSCEGGTGS